MHPMGTLTLPYHRGKGLGANCTLNTPPSAQRSESEETTEPPFLDIQSSLHRRDAGRRRMGRLRPGLGERGPEKEGRRKEEEQEQVERDGSIQEKESAKGSRDS